jgi:hypothetical protein
LNDGYNTTVETIKVDSTIEVTGDRTSRIQRSVWWATDLGIPAKIREIESATTSKGETFERDVTAQVQNATANPESLNDQLVPGDD